MRRLAIHYRVFVAFLLVAGSCGAADSYEYDLLKRTGLTDIDRTREALVWKAGREGWKFEQSYDEAGDVVERMISFETDDADFAALFDEQDALAYLVEHAGTVDFTLEEGLGTIRDYVGYFAESASWEQLRPVKLTPQQRIDIFDSRQIAVYAGFAFPLSDYTVGIMLIEVPVGGPGEVVHDRFDVITVYDFGNGLLGQRHGDQP